MSALDRVPNEALVASGLEIMRQIDKPLERVPARGRAMIYRMRTGETVRIRTSNDHLLVVVADRDEEDAQLNIEGTDYVLIVMPVVPRTHGLITAYLVPTKVVADAARITHREWLATDPNTKGDNRTWNLWFDADGPAKANGFARRWDQYRLPGEASTRPKLESQTGPAVHAPAMKLGDVITAAKRQIAEVAGISPDAVRITVDLS